MRLTFIFLVVLVCATVVLGCDPKCKAKKAKRAQEKKALQKACRELGGGTKIKLEIDLGGACHPPCKNKQKKKKKAPKPTPVVDPPVPALPAAPVPATT
ncbi:hypothetical protein PVAND_005871 [Polypedilum vanderplanki]|uniref:Uncharacterized protein n=1 Tax=Polypedilum vanderplanki TaxID=319348 RepID=A0A9J6C2B6_POLVA|nr:hypothetical protein PVAND_005871 [Polypedilum vanderplanki]